MSQPIRVVAAVVRRDGRFLICERPPHKRHGGLWEFPGGKCEVRESDADAIRRELAEELAVETSNVANELMAITDERAEFTIVFLDVDIVGEPQAIEHSAVRWVSAKELTEMKLAPSDRQFVLTFLHSQ